MARVPLRDPRNVAGPWFVDTRCIDCNTCREVAPEIFGDAPDQALVVTQPATAAEELDAWLAAQACPTSSIGTVDRRPRPGRLYPREVAPGLGVYDVGYCSEDSFGASAWFVVRPDGNVLVDSPRWTAALVRAFGELGGIAHVLLTHQDDVADAARYAEQFGARVWIHRADARAAPFATDVIEGDEHTTTVIAPGVVAAPVPGHTRGSVIYVVDALVALSGDSLAWSLAHDDLTAFRGACWYSWAHQTRSLAAFNARHDFEWLLPGHGGRVHRRAPELRQRLDALVARMAAAA